MNFKRPFHGETQNRVPKRRLDLMSRFIGNASFSLEDLAKRMEPWMREVVREECHRMIPIFGGSSSKILNNPIQNNGEEAGLALKFATNLPESVFTGNKIQADDNSCVLIELIDSRSGSRITTGPLSSLKIDIVVLEGDFDPDESKFNDKIVVQREGRRPLLNGDLTVTLTHGRGCLENVTFTDNSIWSRCRKFKLGARVSRKSHVGEPIREASSRAFVVKDHRGKLSEKHHPPYPNDEVWRLKKIGKDGKYCSRLALGGIKTVKDLLRLREINSSILKKILSGDGSEIPNRAWETIVGHATECKIDDNEMYVYSSSASENPKLFFDQVYRVLGATFDGQEYCPVEKLNVPQTILVQNLKREAFENVNLITPARRTSAAAAEAAGNSRELTCSADERYFSDLLEFPVPLSSDDVLPPTATNNFTTTVNNMWSGSLHGVGPPPIFEDQIGPQFHVSSNFASSQPWMTDHFNGLFFGEMDFGNFSCSPSNLTFCVGPSHEVGPSTPRSRAGWCKIRAALKWRCVGRNLVATRQEVFCR